MHHRFSVLMVSGVIAVLAVTLLVSGISLHAKQQEYAAMETELKKQLEEERARTEEIDDLEDYVGTKEYVEDVAKNKLGLVYPNETIFEPMP